MKDAAVRRSEFLRAGLAAAGTACAIPILGGAGESIRLPEKPHLRIGISIDVPSFLPIYVAAARTWKEQGLDVELLSFRGDAEVAQALAGGSTDINCASPNVLINMISGGQSVIGFFAGFDQADFSWLSIPTVKTWSDLKGKALGVSTFGSLTDALTRYVLRKHDLEPERDVQIVQAGGTPSAYQSLKSGKLAAAIISPPFKWMGPEEGLNLLGTQAQEVCAEWPKNIFTAKTSFLTEYPNTVLAVLRAHVEAIRLAKAQRDFSIQILVDKLKLTKKWSARAYDEMIGAFDERGMLPTKYMPVFWEIAVANGDVKAAWPNSRLLLPRYVETFASWAS